jgi:EAL domain-containing protein (putative c-di-GMP-specific phosphodiesterase class I)
VIGNIVSKPGCPDCEPLPSKVAASGRLHLWFTVGHSAKKLRAYLGRGIRAYEAAEDGRVSIHVEEGGWGGLLDELSALFSPAELDAITALCKAGVDEPASSDLSRLRSLKQLVASGRSDWLLLMLLERRLTCVFQPIVWASNPTSVYGQECLLRAEAAGGCLVTAGPIFEAAREARLLAQIDLAARHAAVREAARHGVEGHLFINIAPACVHDPAACLRSTVGSIDAVGIPRDKVVFEITETDEAVDAPALKSLGDYCRKNGFRVALDDVGSGYSSLNLIHRLRPDFMKLDMDLIREVDREPYKATIARKVIELARDLGVHTIAEGVESAGEMAWVRDHGATFAQGWFIAKPASPPIGDIPARTDDPTAVSA